MTAAPVGVRRATDGDLEAILDLLLAVAAEGRWIATEPPVDTDRRRNGMRALLGRDDAVVYVAVAGTEVVGTLSLELAPYGVADLGMMVAAPWRRQGVGNALLAAAFVWAREAGAHKISLEVWPHNEGAIALYRKAGFEQEGYLRSHYRRRNGELWDAIRMGALLHP